VTAPFALPVRIAVSSVDPWEPVLAILLLLASTWALVRLGGAVYSGSLLRSGGRPRLSDLRRALR
jgi:ABC-2 type transport system permease protein